MPSFQDPQIYRDILDGLQIGVSALDPQKKTVFWSDGAEKITGYARIDVLCHGCAETFFCTAITRVVKCARESVPRFPHRAMHVKKTLTTKMQSLRLGARRKPPWIRVPHHLQRARRRKNET
jgi:PAS domain-containing protein